MMQLNGSDYYKKIGKALKKYRVVNSLSYQELKEKTGLSIFILKQIEAGTRILTLREKAKISKYLNDSVDLLTPLLEPEFKRSFGNNPKECIRNFELSCKHFNDLKDLRNRYKTKFNFYINTDNFNRSIEYNDLDSSIIYETRHRIIQKHMDLMETSIEYVNRILATLRLISTLDVYTAFKRIYLDNEDKKLVAKSLGMCTRQMERLFERYLYEIFSQ